MKDVCEVCSDKIVPGDTVVPVYNVVDVEGKNRYQEFPGSEGPPHAHLSCVVDD